MCRFIGYKEITAPYCMGLFATVVYYVFILQYAIAGGPFARDIESIDFYFSHEPPMSFVSVCNRIMAACAVNVLMFQVVPMGLPVVGNIRES